ncbi:MAG: hypothetical protein Q8L40_00585, partial [Burkholderiales bacterium]|nr:hypothetical protein [Burkholderiales bacterium]
NARVGIDDFVRKTIPKIDAVELPKPDMKISKGEPLFSVRHGSYVIAIASPISGKVTVLNKEHAEHPEWIASKPFELSWMCCIEPSNLPEELPSLKIGADTINWYRGEIDRHSEIVKKAEQENQKLAAAGKSDDKAGKQNIDDKFLEEYARTFLQK